MIEKTNIKFINQDLYYPSASKTANRLELELHKPTCPSQNSSHGPGARVKSARGKRIFHTTAIHGPPTTTPQHKEEILPRPGLAAGTQHPLNPAL